MNTQTQQDDATLVREFQRGDHTVFRWFVQRYESACRYFFMNRSGGDMELAKDLAQEAFIRAFRHLDGLKPPTAFKPWFWTICRNLLIDHVRKSSREAVNCRIVVPSAPEEPAVIVERRQRIQEALSGLTEPQREVVELKYFWDCTLAEVAELTGKPLGTVKTHLTAARRRLLELFEPKGAPAA